MPSQIINKDWQPKIKILKEFLLTDIFSSIQSQTNHMILCTFFAFRLKLFCFISLMELFILEKKIKWIFIGRVEYEVELWKQPFLWFLSVSLTN